MTDRDGTARARRAAIVVLILFAASILGAAILIAMMAGPFRR